MVLSCSSSRFVDFKKFLRLPEVSDETSSKLGDLLNSISSQLPGIDEAMSFSQLMEQVQNMEYDVVVFDTAPTGHTLRLLSFPTLIEKSLDSINSLKSSMGNMLSQITALLGNQGPSLDEMMGKMSLMKETIHKVSLRFKNPSETTFVCVCIPEFLSVYETERLVQQLSKYGINVNSVVINQVGVEGFCKRRLCSPTRIARVGSVSRGGRCRTSTSRRCSICLRISTFCWCRS